MKTIFNDLKDLQVRKFVVYGKAADHKLYYDAAYKEQVSKADVEDAFKKGMLLIVDGESYHEAVSLTGEKVSTLGTTTVGETSSTKTVASLVEWSAKASS